MFNVGLIWNPKHSLEIFESSLFMITEHSYEYLGEKTEYGGQQYILKIKYTSKVPGLKLNPVMMKHPRYKRFKEPNCMALFFAKNESGSDSHELIIDTRTTLYCDIVDYVRPLDSTNLSVDDIIQRQRIYWHFCEQLASVNADNLYMKETTDGKYSLSFEHGGELSVNKMSFDETSGVLTFDMTKLINCIVCCAAYGKRYEVPKTLKDIKINCEIIDERDSLPACMQDEMDE